MLHYNLRNPKYLRINKNNLSEDRSYKNSIKKRYKISQKKDSKNVMKKIKIIVQDELTYKRYMDRTLLELKTFIKKEIKKLKNELFNLQLKLTNG